jgi:uncharacterized protein
MSTLLQNGIYELQVILKLAERCNLACSYCYYFYGGDEEYLKRPPLISLETVSQVAKFIEKGARDLDIPRVAIAFHGGEPLLLKPSRFDKACEILRNEIRTPKLILTVQTNGTLLSERWIEVLAKHQVSVGVSIDGPAEFQNVYRIDHKGRQSYDSVARGIRLAMKAKKEGKLPNVGTISVLNAKFDAVTVYRHLRDELGIMLQSYLLPDINWDTGFQDGESSEGYGRMLCSIFDEWINNDVGSVQIYQIERIVNTFRTTSTLHGRIQIIVIQDTGEVAIDDSYLTALQWQRKIPKVHVSQITLREHFERPIFEEIEGHFANLAPKCQKCAWKLYCNGGDLENRFSSNNGFDNESIFCEGLKLFYEHVAERLVKDGYPPQLIYDRLTDMGKTLDARELVKSHAYPGTELII